MCTFCHRNDDMSDRCHIRKFEEVHKQISKFVIKFKTLRDKIVLNRKKKNIQWVSKAPTQAKP